MDIPSLRFKRRAQPTRMSCGSAGVCGHVRGYKLRARTHVSVSPGPVCYARRDSNPKPLPPEVAADDAVTNGREAASEAGSREANRAPSSSVVSRRDALWGRLDPAIATVSRWADDDPAAMRRLLSDPELQAQLRRALDDLAPDADHDQADQEERRTS